MFVIRRESSVYLNLAETEMYSTKHVNVCKQFDGLDFQNNIILNDVIFSHD